MPIITIAVKGEPYRSYREQFVEMLPCDFHERVNDFINDVRKEAIAERAEATSAVIKPTISLIEHAHRIDRFRDKVSAYYGFQRELIEPVYVADPNDVLKDCAFDVLGVGYEVRNAKLTCTGEVKPYER